MNPSQDHDRPPTKPGAYTFIEPVGPYYLKDHMNHRIGAIGRIPPSSQIRAHRKTLGP